MKKSYLAIILGITCLLVSQVAQAAHVLSVEAGINLDTTKIATLGDVTSRMLESFALEVQNTADIPGDRLILINSNGGDVTAGSRIIGIMEAEKAMHVRQVCLVLERAHSMAFDILAHCDVRLSLQGARLLMHKVATGGIDCQYTRCTAKYLRQLADEMEAIDAPFRRDNIRALKIPSRQYDKLADNDYFWTVPELLKLHFLHGVAYLVR